MSAQIVQMRQQADPDALRTELITAALELASTVTQAAAALPPATLAEAAGALLAETRCTELDRPAQLVVQAVAGALLLEWTHSALDDGELPDDDPEEIAA